MKLIDLFTEDMLPDWEVFEKTFPEMSTCKHSMRWHKEGSPLTHTKLVTKEMYNKISGIKDKHDEEWYLIMMSAAMLHDIGKPSSTFWNEEKEDWSCKRHGEVGEHLFRDMFFEERLDLREKVAYMIRYHMMLHNTLNKDKKGQERDFSMLLNGTVPFNDMLLLKECDMRGSINDENEEDFITNCINEIVTAKDEFIEQGKHKKWGNVDEHCVKMYVMIGVPGSGKSTYAEKLSEVIKCSDLSSLPIISRDTVRVELGLCNETEKCVGTKDEEKKVTKLLEEKIINIASVGKSFIIDNTSLKKVYRDAYYNTIKEFNVVPIFIYVEAPSLKDNFARRYGQIDESIIQHMYDNFEFPSKSECAELWLVDQRNDITYKI